MKDWIIVGMVCFAVIFSLFFTYFVIMPLWVLETPLEHSHRVIDNDLRLVENDAIIVSNQLIILKKLKSIEEKLDAERSGVDD